MSRSKKFGALVEQDSYHAILKFILFSGVRESEAIGLTWDCIDFDRGTIRIYRQMLKRTKETGGYTLASLKERQRTSADPTTDAAEYAEKSRSGNKWSSV